MDEDLSDESLAVVKGEMLAELQNPRFKLMGNSIGAGINVYVKVKLFSMKLCTRNGVGSSRADRMMSAGPPRSTSALPTVLDCDARIYV